MGQLEHTMIQNVGVKYAGIGRQVYPGSLQLYSFLSMNMDRHSRAFMDQIFRVAKEKLQITISTINFMMSIWL